MRLKLFHAAKMAEAMASVRAQLGPDALIIATRRVSGGVEVTAALEPFPPRPEEAERDTLLQYHDVPGRLRSRLSRGPLEKALGGCFRFASLPIGGDDPPLLFAGPPGAGKTVTVARLATRLVLGKVAPLVVTADGQRAGAVEQLAAFTRLLGIELVVANHPGTLARALERRRPGAPVLIDSAGMDARDPIERAALDALIGAVGASVVLVLAGNAHPVEAAELATAFAEAGADRMVATRLDQTRRLGPILIAADAGRLALAEAGIGSGAADGLVPLTPSFLAERLSQAAAQRMGSPA